jgi:hypothetical protein
MNLNTSTASAPVDDTEAEYFDRRRDELTADEAFTEALLREFKDELVELVTDNIKESALPEYVARLHKKVLASMDATIQREIDNNAEAERDDERMCDPAEIAAAREYHRECREDRQCLS